MLPRTRRIAVFFCTCSAWMVGCGSHGSDMHGNGMDSGGSLGLGTPLLEGQELVDLPRLANASSTQGLFEATITASTIVVQHLGTVPTLQLGYNGGSPGPTIDVREGDRVRITFTNLIPAQPSTIHWHGLRVPADQDGNPMDAVPAGGSRVYEFTVPADSAGTYWYHPHPHPYAAEQVALGLAGAFIVRPQVDPLPAGLEEHVLLVTDVRLDAAGRMTGYTMDDMMRGRIGSDVLVNGRRNPVLTSSPGATLRLRIVNATTARYLRMDWDVLTMTLVGSDGGLIAAPEPIPELLLAPAERAEIVVQLPTAGTTQAVLRLLPHDNGPEMVASGMQRQSALLTLRALGEVRSPVLLPASLRMIEMLSAPVATKRLELTETPGMVSCTGMMGSGMSASGMMGTGMMGTEGMIGWRFLINGRAFDMGRTDLVSRVGDVELWEVVNRTSMDHPFHVHGTQFQIVERERGGAWTQEPLLAWKDTVSVGRLESVRLLVRQDLPGLRMFHCHILEHEALGMMGVLSVQ